MTRRCEPSHDPVLVRSGRCPPDPRTKSALSHLFVVVVVHLAFEAHVPASALVGERSQSGRAAPDAEEDEEEDGKTGNGTDHCTGYGARG
jgi:hypothetical protein